MAILHAASPFSVSHLLLLLFRFRFDYTRLLRSKIESVLSFDESLSILRRQVSRYLYFLQSLPRCGLQPVEMVISSSLLLQAEAECV